MKTVSCELAKEMLDALIYAASRLDTDKNDPIDLMIAKAKDAMDDQTLNDDGWVKWEGGECPVCGDALVWARFRHGDEECDFADRFRWRHAGDDACSQYAIKECDIIAYRIYTGPQKCSDGLTR